jgi:hypothetical protein
VVSQQAASLAFPGVVFFGDGAAIYANDVSGGNGNCDPESASAISNNQPVVAGPIAFRCTSGCSSGTDEVYALVSDGNSSQLLRFTYRGGLSYVSPLNLPWGAASGLATSGPNLPASVAITFKGGGISLVSIAANGLMSLVRSTPTAGITGAPCFSQCGNIIAIGTQDGGLYLYDPSLNPLASWQGSSPINTTPGVDGAGDWYVGADSGYIYEIQMQAGKLVPVNQYGPMGQVGSSVQVGGCATGICVYVGSLNHSLYRIALNARDAVLWACISSCSGANPRLWTQVEIGDAVSPLTVHVQGWSYYSA